MPPDDYWTWISRKFDAATTAKLRRPEKLTKIAKPEVKEHDADHLSTTIVNRLRRYWLDKRS